MRRLVVIVDDQFGQPLFQLFQGEHRVGFRIVFAFFPDIGVGASLQLVDFSIQCSQQTLDVGAVTGLFDRPPRQVDVVIRTGLLQHFAPELSGVVRVNGPHLSPHGPGSVFHPQLRQPFFLRQNASSNAKSSGEVPRGIQGNVETDHDPAEHIDRESDPWTPDGEPVNLFHQNDVEGRVIDLHHFQWPVGIGKFSLVCGKRFVGQSRSRDTTHLVPLGQPHDPTPDRTRVGWFEASVLATPLHHIGYPPYRALARPTRFTLPPRFVPLSIQIVLIDGLAHDLLHIGG